MKEYLIALFLGFIEGLTEFIPVSSTGHLILLIEGLNFPAPPGRVFEVFIQIGAILAIMVLYRAKIWHTASRIHHDPVAQSFARNIIIGTLPALFFGAFLHGFIKNVLYDPIVIAVSLIIGGIIIILFERKVRVPSTETVDEVTPKQALMIGLFQSIALIPGVSRSGATIIGSLSIGLSRKAAAEFSFFLAIPIMFCAVAYDLYRNWNLLVEDMNNIGLMVAGLFAAFITALVVVKSVIAFITRYGFTPFGWYRVALGLLALYIFL